MLLEIIISIAKKGFKVLPYMENETEQFNHRKIKLEIITQNIVLLQANYDS
jgi:hypothetical protein